MSALASSMIWSMFSVAWIFVVTSCSWRKKRASKDTPRCSGGSCCDSKNAWESCSLGLSTALMSGLRSEIEFLACVQPADVVGDVGAERLRLVELLDLRH